MNSVQVFVRRPVLATVLSLVVILLGLVAWDRLQVRQYPKVSTPVVSIRTELHGAGAEIIESQITKPLENVLTSISGIDTITSTSRVGESKITIKFQIDRDIDAATNDVRDRVGRVRDKFPQGVTESLIKKSETDALPFFFLSITSDRHPIEEITDLVQKNLEIDSQIEAVNGVSQAEITGGGEYEMRLRLDPLKMASFKITTEDVISAVRKQNVERPSGQIYTGDREITITTKAALTTEEDYNNMIIAERNNYLVRLSDVGKAVLATDERGYRNRFEGRPSVVINVYKQSTANPLLVADGIRELLPKLQRSLPKGMVIDVAHDDTTFIKESINKVYHTMFEAVVLVILVVFLFLGSFRAALVPIVTIPVSLIGTFFFMDNLDFTINTLTLLSMVMAIGLVVDDAIVVLENVYRYLEEGMSPLKAAVKGASEIAYPVIAMTLTLAAVYAPIALSSGLAGKVFTEFAITLVVAVIISGFVALTLSPMMCGRFLKSLHTGHGADDGKAKDSLKQKTSLENFGNRFQEKVEILLKTTETRYRSSLNWVLEKRLYVLIGALVFSSGGWVITAFLGQELVPQEDKGYFRMQATTVSDATLEFTDRYMLELEKVMQTMPELKERLVSLQAPGTSYALATLKDWSERDRGVVEIMNSIKPDLDKITGMRVSLVPPRSDIGGGDKDESDIHIVLLGSKPFKALVKETNKVKEKLSKMKGLAPGVLSDILSAGQEYQVTVHRDKAAALGIDVATISDVLNSLIGKRTISHFKLDNKRYRIRLDTEKEYRRTAEDVMNYFVRGSTVKDGKRQEVMIPLNEVVKIEPRQAPLTIPHYKGLRSLNIYANLDRNANTSLGEMVKKIEEEIVPTIPEGFQIEFVGESQRYKQEQRNIVMIYLLSVLFIFLVLAAQYESFIDPFIILSSIPLSVVGGLVVLKLAGGTMNLYSQIGLVTLIGLIAKHGILIVDFANHAREQGVEKLQAIAEAAHLRLRPILMTTFAMVVGAIPLALSVGAGAESRQQIGWVVVGGMTFGTLFTLYIVPVIYSYLSQKREPLPLE